MRKLLLGLLLGGLLGIGAGVALGFFLFPFVFPPPVAMDALSENERQKVVATGEFLHANPADPIHYGRGRVTVTPRTVFLESDFEVGPGPAFHVYLVPKKEVRRSRVASIPACARVRPVDPQRQARAGGSPAILVASPMAFRLAIMYLANSAPSGYV
jgi:hypothetical protein